jgi:hypothetical protein
MRLTRFLPLLLAAAACLPGFAHASAPLRAADISASPGTLCLNATVNAERTAHLPPRLLDAIALVESGRRDAQGVLMPWPWTINVQGVGHFYETKAEAIAAVQQFQAQGIKSMDVGCMQINLMYHPTAFASLDQAFDPQANTLYAATFITQLYGQTGSWPKAAAAYHSQTPDVGVDYQRRVMALWPEGAHMTVAAASIPTMGNGAEGQAQAATPLLPSPFPTNRVAMMLPGGNAPARLLPLATSPLQPASAATTPPSTNAMPQGTGRTLDAYRAMPVRAIGRVMFRGG